MPQVFRLLPFIRLFLILPPAVAPRSSKNHQKRLFQGTPEKRSLFDSGTIAKIDLIIFHEMLQKNQHLKKMERNLKFLNAEKSWKS